MAERFQIRVQEASDLCRSYGRHNPIYSVWDNELDKRVPFGNYGRACSALARLVRVRRGA